MPKQYYIYMITNKYLNVLYTGVTNNLPRRIYEHKTHCRKGFTRKYNIDRLVYYEIHIDIVAAIAREKQIKAWSRKKKDALVNKMNPTWRDLYDEIRCAL